MIDVDRLARIVQESPVGPPVRAAVELHMTRDDDNNLKRPTRAQRLVAFGFLGAFGLTILTVLLTGLWVRGPNAGHREPPAVEQPGAASQPTDAQPEAPNRPAIAPPPAEPAGTRDPGRAKTEEGAREAGATDPAAERPEAATAVAPEPAPAR
jgi:hypothetical protein